MSGLHLYKLRFVNTAHGFYRGAPGVKPASGRRIDRAWYFHLWNRMRFLILWICYWNSSIANTYFVFQVGDRYK
jgi:hypothetical protein